MDDATFIQFPKEILSRAMQGIDAVLQQTTQRLELEQH